jgi:hypothetical protein
MINRNLTRRLEHLESRFQQVFEPRAINIQFVNYDFEVVSQNPDNLIYAIYANRERRR